MNFRAPHRVASVTIIAAGLTGPVAAQKPPFPTPIEQVGVNVGGAFIPARSGGDQVGRSVAGAGDVNGDGVADLLVGAPEAGSAVSPAGGEAFLIFGGNGGVGAGGFFDTDSLNGSDGVRFDGLGSGARAGRAVSGVGDVNADGFDDFVIGAPSTNASTDRPGTAYLIFGRPVWSAGEQSLTELTSTEAVQIDGIDLDDRFAVSVSGAGDLNADGVADLVIGASHANPLSRETAGEAYVIFGRTTGFPPSIDVTALDGSDGVRIMGSEAGDNVGVSVAGAGDLNGDGIDDLLLGAEDAGVAGGAFVVRGSAAGIGAAGALDLSAVDGAQAYRMNGIASGDKTGRSVAGLGDVNGDGLADVIVGAGQADPSGATSAGEAYVLYGASGGINVGLPEIDLSLLNGVSGTLVDGQVAGNRAGEAVAGLGDVDGDGESEVFVGTPMNDRFPPNNRGAGFIFFGQSNLFSGAPVFGLGFLTNALGLRFDGFGEDSRAGSAAAALGDVNGDGVNDFAISAHLEDLAGASSGGQVYVVFGWFGSVNARALAAHPPGASPRRWIGALANGQDPWGPVRAAISYSAGTGPGLGQASSTEVALFRTPPTGDGLPAVVLQPRWQVTTDRESFGTAQIVFHYTPLEVLLLDQETLQIYRADAPEGPWSPVATTVDIGRNEITATGVNQLGHFALGTESFLTSQQVVDHLLGRSSLGGKSDSADVNRSGEVDVGDLVIFVNVGL